MEATQSRGKTSKRKPFTDLSNITPSSLPSSIKFKPQTSSSHSLPLKSLLNNADLNSDANSTSTASPINHSVNNDKKNKKDKVKGPSNTTNPSSTLSLPPKTPAVSGDFDEFSEFLFWVLIGFQYRVLVSESWVSMELIGFLLYAQ
ncbi:hypothetical protein V6N13_034151 [Hibiscus sabdariffa]|uniref:Uncharacterized protein n=1 Tax=Hibiscus sabdariffa TaxID=183260 RepID=A0ABR2F8H0_9ROSI